LEYRIHRGAIVIYTIESVAAVIAEILVCEPTEIQNITVMEHGMTNRSYEFTYKNSRYLMRIPGEGTELLLNRENEYLVYQQVEKLGICEDIIYINPKTGCKITTFWENARVCNAQDFSDVSACMKLLKTFHEANLKVPHYFDVFERIEFYESLRDAPSRFSDYSTTKANIMKLKCFIDEQQITPRLSHIDSVSNNFLFVNGNGQERLLLIDWEYAAMQDPHIDIAMFAIYSMYEREDVDKLIDCYFDNACPPHIRAKIYAYIAICGLLWSNWCEYKRKLGVEFGEYELKQYEYAREYYNIFTELR